jgi:malate/lactate dehydrogenase
MQVLGTPLGKWVSMGVVSDGSYGVQPGLVFSYPVTCSGGKWSIVQGECACVAGQCAGWALGGWY